MVSQSKVKVFACKDAECQATYDSISTSHIFFNKKGKNFWFCHRLSIFCIDSLVSKNIQNWIQMLHYLKLDVTFRLVLMRSCNWANLNCSVAAWASRKTLMIDLRGWVGIGLQALWVEAEHPAGRIKKEKGEEMFITHLLTFYGSVMVNWEMNAYY